MTTSFSPTTTLASSIPLSTTPTSTSFTLSTATATVSAFLDCGGADLCFNVSRPAIRGSAQLLLTVFVPIVTTAFKTLWMTASRNVWKRIVDFLLRLFFPELGLTRVVAEEADRAHYLKVLRGMNVTATSQQLMAIQQGKLHFSMARCNPSFTHHSPSPSANSSFSKFPISQGGNTTSTITWCSQKPCQNMGYRQLEIQDVYIYKDIIQSLPTGNKTMRGIGLPDSTTVILTIQLIWLIINIVLRLVWHYLPAVIELYSLYSLTCFVAERILTSFNAPAWGQHVVFTSSTPPFLPMNSDHEKRSTWKEVLVIVPILLTAAWPVYMFLYGYKGSAVPDDQSFTFMSCKIAGGMYAGAAFYLIVAGYMKESESAVWRAMRWIPIAMACGSIILSKLVMCGIGVYQAFYGQREIFLMPRKNWDIPHLTG